MQALFTGALGDFIGAESFMTEQEKDSVTTLLWATRNRTTIQESIDLTDIFPNLKEEKILFDNFADKNLDTPWKPGDPFANIHKKDDLNFKCNLNLSKEELDNINDCSLDATLARIFKGHRWQSSRYVTRGKWGVIDHFNLPKKYAVIHPWSDAEICGREFNDHDWDHIIDFLDSRNIYGVIVNQSQKRPPTHKRLLDLTNQTTIKETWGIVSLAKYSILCSSSIACFASKIFPKDYIWIKGGHPYIFTEWATYFYHGPFYNPSDIVFKDLSILSE
jgi:hypothetical protein